MLPHVDEPAVSIDADRDAVWAALVDVLDRSFSSGRQAHGARLLGCRHVTPRGTFPELGSEVPGFGVEVSEPPRLLGLVGRHRHSSYTLTFRLAEEASDRTLVRAETRAAFPGAVGRLYRAIVIGSGMHARLMRALLARIKGRAEGS